MITTIEKTIEVAVVETDVFGVLAYHAQCLTCGVRVCDHYAHDAEATAAAHAAAHACERSVSQ